MAVLGTSSVGFGTYFGIIFVFLRSNPTIEVPRGTITPPSTELNLCNILPLVFKSKLDSKLSESVSVETTAPA